MTTVFSYDRAFSGPRAVFFNIFQAATTVGAAVEPFLASGFTQGVSIFGGGFTQGVSQIWKDMSATQLQNLTSQAFQGTEQVGPNGGFLQKDIFLPKTNKTTNFESQVQQLDEENKRAAAKAKKNGQPKPKRKNTIRITNMCLQIIPITSPTGH